MATQTAVDGDIMVFMDGDGADDPGSIAALVAPIRAGAYDFVIGSRVRGEREPGSIAWHQIGAGMTRRATACGSSTACATPTCARSAPSGATCCWRSTCTR